METTKKEMANYLEKVFKVIYNDFEMSPNQLTQALCYWPTQFRQNDLSQIRDENCGES